MLRGDSHLRDCNAEGEGVRLFFSEPTNIAGSCGLVSGFGGFPGGSVSDILLDVFVLYVRDPIADIP